ncbi:MAG: hypothetical protein AUG20_04545 [Gemmatimonas sp. 13_1_20CM_3_60_15]|nr:MAG: hypothetical protein AUG20_04545 [Gemmatimonas sp. 13_1_20CM_3_60_15]
MRLFLVVAAAGLTACSRRPYVEPAPPHGVVLKSAKLGLYRKEVVTKQEPDTFVAPDATFCRVSPDVFKSTSLHSIAYCNWQ